MDKENSPQPNLVTRIPLPKKPTKSIPKYLLTKTNTEKREQARQPLETLLRTNSNIPSTSKALQKVEASKNATEINEKHVTLRPRNENWNYKVFEQTYSDDDVAKIEKKEFHYFVECQRRGGPSSAVTPALKSLENKHVKNIKRSLKRPHSRELIGVTPPGGKRDRCAYDKKLLTSNEPIHKRLQAPDFWQRSYMKCLDEEYNSDIFHYLLCVEKRPLAVPRPSNVTRACVINWLMKVNGADGNPATLQIACWYFDSILGISQVHVKKLQLVAAACFWLAQKLISPVIPAMRLVKYANAAFSVEMLLTTEKAVLEKLKFPAKPVVPQEFITYLSWCCDEENPGEIEVAATFLCMTALMVDKMITVQFPSVIAAASVRIALLLLNKRDLFVKLTSNAIYQAAEKKSHDEISTVSLVIRRAVRTVSASIYEYKAPLEHYDVPPYFIAQKMIRAASLLDKQ